MSSTDKRVLFWGIVGFAVTFVAAGAAMGVKSSHMDAYLGPFLVGLVGGVIVAARVGQRPSTTSRQPRQTTAAANPLHTVLDSQAEYGDPAELVGATPQLAATDGLTSPSDPGVYGPNSPAVVAFIRRCGALTPAELGRLASGTVATEARDAVGRSLSGGGYEPPSATFDTYSRASDAVYAAASRDSGRKKAVDAAYEAARETTMEAIFRAPEPRRGQPEIGSAWEAATGAAIAITVADLVSRPEFDALTAPWREAGLPLPEPQP